MDGETTPPANEGTSETKARPSPGERLVKRMLSRERRRPRLGFAPEFYARFGMDDPWSAPSTGGPAPEGDGFVYLSAAPYYAMMRRLADARRRRERRLAEFTSRRAGTQLRAAKRAWPGMPAPGGTNLSGLTTSRLARVALDDMILPPPLPAAQPEVAEEAAAEGSGRSLRRDGWRSRPSLFAKHEPAAARSVAAARDRAELRPRAADHAGARIARAATAAGAVSRIVEQAAPVLTTRHRAALQRVVETVEALPVAEQAAEIRRIVRRVAALGPIARTVVEEMEPAPRTDGRAASANAMDVARSRMGGGAPERTKGLRPVLSRSPAMALAAAPELDRAAAGTLAEADRTEGGRQLAGSPRRVSSSQRAAARSSAGAARAGSALPAAIPAAIVAAARPSATRSLVQRPVARVASDGPPARAFRPSPGAPAAADEPRAEAAPSSTPSRSPRRSARPAVEQSGAPRVRSAEVGFAPEGFADIASAEVAPSRARRAASTAHAFARSAAAIEAPLPTPASEPVVARVRAVTYAAERAEVPAASPSLLPRHRIAAPSTVLAAPPAAMPASEEAAASPIPGPGPRARAVRRAAAAIAPGLVPARASEPRRTESGVFVPAERPSARPTPSVRAARRAAVPSAPEAGQATISAAPARRARTAADRESAVVTALASGPVARGSATEHASARATAPRAAASTFAPASPAMTWASARQDLDTASESTVTPQAAPASRAGRLVERAVRRDVAPAAARTTAPRARAAEAAPVRLSPVGAVTREALRTSAPTGTRRAASAGSVATSSVFVQPGAAAAEPTVTEPRPFVPARVFRAMSVAAAARAGATVLLTRTGERVLAMGEAAQSPEPARSTARFTRSGPMAFAQAQTTLLAALAEERAAAAPARATRPSVTRAPSGLGRSPVAALLQPASPDAFAPSTPVPTPGGTWVGARAAESGGLRIVATRAGRLLATAATTTAAPASDAPVTRAIRAASPVRTLAAPPVPAIDETLDARPRLTALPRRVSHAERVLGRAGVAEATAYRGAYRSPEATPLAGTAAGTAAGAAGSEAAPVARTPGPVRTAEPTRRTRASSPERTLAASPAEAAPVARTREPLESRLLALSEGRSDGGRSWVDRAEGSPRVATVSGLFQALARATTAEQVADVIIARQEGAKPAPLPLDAPALQVIQQIREEVRHEVAAASAPMWEPETLVRESRLHAPDAEILRTRPQSKTRVSKSSVRPVSASARTAQGGAGAADRITKLVRKLESLIHLAEAEHRLADARRQVRMAEDSPGARAEGSGPVGQGKAGNAGDQKKHDIEALGRDVLEYVNNELNLRRSRRMEDSDDSVGW